MVTMSSNLGDSHLTSFYADLSIRQATLLSEYCRIFLAYEEAKLAEGVVFDYGDCSIGNLLFAGCYLITQQNFNQTVSVFSQFCEIPSSVLNITDGKNYVLVALKKNGVFLPDEASIVMPQQDNIAMQEIFLLENYLSSNELAKFELLPVEQKLDFLRSHSYIPQPNLEAIKAIATADLIIYGPGTQHSSLFPSYLTDGTAEAVAGNTKAEKIFIGNIVHDNDIQNETVAGLLKNFRYYMNRKGSISLKLSQFITQLFVQEPDYSDINRQNAGGSYIPIEMDSFDLENISVKKADWELYAGHHAGGQIVDEVLGIVCEVIKIKLKSVKRSISIIIPVLNESRTVQRVLNQVGSLDFTTLDLDKEVILIDGGSTDGTLEIAREYQWLRVYTLETETGRGAAMRLGITKARGNIIVFFPGDAEYEVGDIQKVIEPIIGNQFNVVFGSRAIKCFNLNQRIRHIYSNNWLSYLISKYGGMLTSILCLLLYNRYITDPFSTLKAFDGYLLKSLDLHAKGVDLDSEIIAKLSLRQEFILEIPVEYKPRTKLEGKKIRTGDGVKMLFGLIINRFV